MQIYLIQNGHQIGPFTMEQVRAMLAAQSITLNDQGWHEGLTDWQPLNTFLPSPPKPTAPFAAYTPARPVQTHVKKPTATFPAYAPARPVHVNVNQGPRVVTRGHTAAGSGNSSPIAQNMPSFIAALLMCIAFFLPWASFGPIGISASTMASIGGRASVLWAILIMAVISVITHFVNPKKVLNVVTGIIPLVILTVIAFNKGEDFFKGLGVGVLLTLGCGITLIVAPVKSLQSA